MNHHSTPLKRKSNGHNDDDNRSSANVRRKKKTSRRSIPSGLLPPKRPMNAYNFFYKEQRRLLLGENATSLDQVSNGYTVKAKRLHKKVHGKISLVELAKTVGQRWRALDESEAEKYRLLAQADSIRYKRDVEVYKQLNMKQSARNSISEDSKVEAANKPCDDITKDVERQKELSLKFSEQNYFEAWRASRNGTDFVKSVTLGKLIEPTSLSDMRAGSMAILELQLSFFLKESGLTLE